MSWDIEYTDEFGGDKTGNARWYDVNIPIADRIYDKHLEQLRKEGLTNG